MSGDLHWNKIFGAALATGLVILGVREVSTRMFASEPPEKMGYNIEVADEGAAEGACPPGHEDRLPFEVGHLDALIQSRVPGTALKLTRRRCPLAAWQAQWPDTHGPP